MTRLRRLAAPGVTLGGLAAAALALHLRDPHESGSWGRCPSAALGFWCPGCGGLRAVHDLTDGRLADAASSNLLLVVLLPVAAVVYLVWVAHRWRGETGPADPRLLAGGTRVLVVAAVGFAVARNLPAGAWLAP